jgi:hypothetical protein
VEASRQRASDLHDQAVEALSGFGAEASLLRDLAFRITHRVS